MSKSNKKNQKKKSNQNLFTMMHRHKKQVVMGVSLLLIAAMVLSVFAQFAF